MLVHGGGKRLTEWLSRMGVESRFEGGLRVTDDAALEVALAVLGGVINGELVAVLRAPGRTLWAFAASTAAPPPSASRTWAASRTRGRARSCDPCWRRSLATVRAGHRAWRSRRVICNVNADDAAAALAGALGGG